VLKYNDDDGEPMVTKILDSAGQKGTGKWTAINALDMGMPVTLIGEAVFARCLSALKGERGRAAKALAGPEKKPFTGDKQQFMCVCGGVAPPSPLAAQPTDPAAAVLLPSLSPSQ
jgi:6-phosphogluconate dehydrogenase